MTIRIVAILLAAFGSITLHAADEAASETLADAPSEPTVRFPVATESDIGIVFLRRTADHPKLTDDVDGVFQNQNHEFPFPPRLIRQSNYDIEIVDEPLLSEEFRNDNVLKNGNTARSDAAASGIIQTSGTLTVDGADCNAGGPCFRQLHADERPIDVLLVGCEEQCGARSCPGACDDGCPDAAAAQASEQTPDSPGDCVDRPSYVEIQHAHPKSTHPHAIAPLHGARHPYLGRLDRGFSLDTLPAKPIASIAEDRTAESNTIFDACSHAEPPLKAKVEHLFEAARHLAGAGYEEEARLFRVEAEAIQRASTRLLTEKRQELERLQREIAELELLTGQYDLIQINFSILEFTLPADCDAEACSALHKPGIHVLTSEEGSSTSPTWSVVSKADLVQLLKRLEASACSKPATIFAPKIVTTNGRTAMISNGGSVVVPVSSEIRGDAKAGASHDTQRYGIELQALPIAIGNDKVRLNLVTEISERDFSNAVDLSGTAIPGLTTRRCNTTVETPFGDLVAISFTSAKGSDGEQKCMLVLVTPYRVAPLDGCPVAE